MNKLTSKEMKLLSITVSVLDRVLGDINNGKYQINSGIHLADVDEREQQQDAIKLLIKKLRKWIDEKGPLHPDNVLRNVRRSK